MQPLFDFLLRYGYLVLFLNVFCEQVGVPVPAVPMMLAMGALAGLGKLSLGASFLLAASAALLGDWIWYELGRRKGHAILQVLCRVSLEPDSCVSNTKRRWSRFGGYTLLFAKFIPGLSTVATPLAGLTGMPTATFLFLDLLGSAAWSGAYLGIGFLFHNQIEAAAETVQRLGASLLVLVVAVIALYVGWKYLQRRRFLNQLRSARIEAPELLRLIETGEDVVIIDLRNALEIDRDNTRVPSAIWIDPANIGDYERHIPRDREIVLYCS